MLLETVTVDCPWCGESFSTTADLSAGSQQYIEDCQICCQPIEFHLQAGPDGELLSLSTRREND